MQAFGVPRLDAGAEGIHLVWTWPDVLPVSQGGYDIQRLGSKDQRWQRRCETIDPAIVGYLLARGEYPASLGPLRLRPGASFGPITDSDLLSPNAGTAHSLERPADSLRVDIDGALAAMVAKSPIGIIPAAANYSALIQELTDAVQWISIDSDRAILLALALCNGKVVQWAVGNTAPVSLQLFAPSIDTVVLYTSGVSSIQICAMTVVDANGGAWSKAPYIAKGLTLPIHETDPALVTPVQEYAAAKARLLPAETLIQGDFGQFAETLRAPASASTMGRPGERMTLVRSDPAQSYEELSLDGQLSMLALHPKLRRVLGFAFRDNQGLVANQAYLYRITGRFLAEDLTDEIYDVHRVPTSTVLPAAVSIRDLTLRFQTPVKVVLDPAPPDNALRTVSRRGIRIDTTGYDSSWLLPSYDAWSAIIGFPRAVTKVVLEVAPGHSFSYAGGLSQAFGSPPQTPLPGGSRVELTFATGITELRMAGTGTLYAVRLPSGSSGIVEVHAYTAPIVYAAQPLPAPPVVLTCYSFQQPQAVLNGPIDESTPVAPRPPVGFKLNWLPATIGGLGVWPTDIDSGPPLDTVAYQIEHRAIVPPAPPGAWEAIAGDDNLTLGSRDDTAPLQRLTYGCDLDALFPAIRPRSPTAGFLLHLSDVFGETDPSTGKTRSAQPPGSFHQYEIRSMDAVGRISATATLSNVARLEKHIPPPLPVGPQPEPVVDAQGRLTAPPGPRARAIVKGAPGLPPEDVALLGTHANAILLEWGWRQQERELDPATAEFRAYSSKPADVINASITAVNPQPGFWQIAMTTSLPLIANELAGQWITSNGYPFRIVQNDAGTTPGVQVERSFLLPALQPTTGPVTFGRPLRPEHQNPGGWAARVAIYPLTASNTYRHVFYDLLTLGVSNPRDAIWVGVSAADSQSYISDQRTTGANANRPGNESAVVTCAVTARYRGQPTFSIPPPLGDVPEIVTDEPTGRQVVAVLDLNALLGGALPSGSPVALERCSADDVISRASVAGGAVLLTHPDGTEETIVFGNPGDEAAVLATLGSDNPQRLVNKYLLHLVAASGDSSVFFERVSGDIDQVGAVSDRLAPKPGRFLYRVRAADSLGHVSDGGAILPVVVRVPSTASATTPQRRSLTTTDTAVELTVGIAADPDTTTALLFGVFAPPGSDPPKQGEAQLLRTPNRRDLYPNDGLRLRLSDGTLLAPLVAKDLGDADVTVLPDGTRIVVLEASTTKGSWATLWCYALTRDGLPSYACGPFGTGVHA